MKENTSTEETAKLAEIQAAVNDELFLSDLYETMKDFEHSDVEALEQT